jgi:photosystem II stability/assembly factor-like uncharacterized protein
MATDEGIWSSDDADENWRRLSAPRPGLAVWSLARHPNDLNTILAGYEPCAIYRSSDDGMTWSMLPVNTTFPAISTHPDIPKRVISIAIDPTNTEQIYASVEVGGLLRSLNGGQSWENVIDGIYLDEGFVDVHSVIISAKYSGLLTIATRFGTFRSDDRGGHWRDLRAPRLRPAGSYCRVLRYAPGDSETIYLAAGSDFDGDRSALCISRDNGANWQMAEPGVWLKTPIFGLAVGPNYPDHVFFSSKIGQIVYSLDRGKSWAVNPLPHGAGHVFSLAVG